MGSFKEIGDSQIVSSKYSGRVIIYLESKEDYQIFAERWFHDEGEWLEFRSSDLGDGGGCNNVISNVKNDRTHHIPSFGIVDRDSLMRQGKWEVFWEKNDSAYKAMRPFGDHVLPLCRWELENYLLDIDEIESLIADLGKEAPKATRKRSEIAQELCDHCNALTPIMAYNILCHQNGLAALPIKYKYEELERKRIEEDILQRIEHLEEKGKNFTNVLSKIEDFNSNGESSDQKFYKYNRMIDGKRIFARIERQNRLKQDYRFFLARRIKENGNIDKELTDLIDSFKS